MGVPAFFKWLTLRYPKVVMDAVEEINPQFDINDFLKTKYNADTSMPFIDNLYLDMNGIIHPCCHPVDRPQPKTEEEMFDNVFDYTDKLIRIIKPKKLLYLAVDGVAPRAKMNQQRSRRFRAAQEAKEKSDQEKELLKDWKEKGLKEPEEKPRGFDSNIITPGTTFMHRLAQALKVYISHRLQFDHLWKGLTVIFSDSNVPGEGEHKILEFIRTQRTQDHYDPNTKHCIYGADADLIMLSLITHEPHFFIIRESLNDNMWKKCEHCGGNGHLREECPKLLNPGVVENKNSSELIDSIEFSLIKVHIVREYLELEFKHVKLNFDCDEKIKFERFIDDFVFLCFFVGNDFIPHLPSLKIREGAIDALLYLYKKLLPSLDGFLTEGNGQINLTRTEILLSKLSLVEDEIFKRQLFAKNRELQRNAQRLIEQGRLDRSQYRDEVVREFFELKTPAKEVELTNKEEIQLFDDVLDDIEKMINKQENESEQDKLKKLKLSQEASENFQRVLKEVMKSNQNKKMEGYQDPVRLGEEGWKSRYYEEKFKVTHDDHEFLKLIRQAYIEGISWVFSYYYNGCVSWEWYYPFHYAPFASDLCNIKDLDINFKMGAPFEPVQQLLSVLPPYSSNALPKCLQILMHDPLSELSDFYPETIKLDINGQAFAWMGVNLIPFIDENRIRKAVDNKRADFTEEEKNRNRFGETLVFFDSKTHFISNHAVGDNYNQPGYYTYISTPNFRTFAGKVKCVDDSSEIQNLIGTTLRSKIKGLKIKEVRNCTILGMVYENPSASPHNSYLRKGLNLPPKVVMEDNLDYYCKRNFRGEEAIETVRKCLGYDQEEIEKNVRNELFDNTYNNNRAIEYNPNDMELLRKKRYKQNEEGDGNRDRDYNRNNDRYFNRDNNNYNRNRNSNYQGNNYNPNYQGNNYNPNYQRNNYHQQNKSFKTGYNQYPNQNAQNNPQNYNQFNNPNIKTNVQNFLLQNASNANSATNANNTPPNPLNQNQRKQQDESNNGNDVGRDPNEALNNLIKYYQNYVGNLNNSQNK